MRNLVLPLLIATSGLPVTGQTVHVVGTGAHAEIRDALAVAASGDVIVVSPGNYAHFEASMGVTIRAIVPGTVSVRYDPTYAATPGCNNIFCAFLEGPSRIDLAASETVRLLGLTFVGNTAMLGTVSARHRLEIRGGTAVLEHCTLDATDSVALFVENCTLHGQGLLASATNAASFIGSEGLKANNSFVTLIDSAFQGSNGLLLANGSGVRLSSSTLHGSNLVLLGATGGSGLTADSLSEVWLSDSSIIGGPGVCAMTTPGTAGGIDRCSLSSSPGTCSQLPQTPLMGVNRPQPPIGGQSFTVNHFTAPNALVGLIGSFELDYQQIPQVEQPWLAPLASSAPIGITVADPSGVATASWNLPAIAHVDLTLWVHAVSGTSLPLQAAPATGGLLR